MVTTLGAATTGHTAEPARLDLPRHNGHQRAHRPWCAWCCKTKNPDQLNRDGHCDPCADKITRITAAAERRREMEREAAKVAAPVKVQKKAPKKHRTPRTAGPHPHAAEIIARYQGGDDILPLATEYHIAERTIRKMLDAEGIARRPRTYKRGVHVNEAEMVAAYLAGETIPKVATRFGCYRARVEAILDRHNIERRDDRVRKTGLTDDQAAHVVALYGEGMSQVNIAAATGHPRRLVRDTIVGAGVTIRPAGRVTKETR